MMSRSDNHESLKCWVGAIPDHGEPLGAKTICFDICALMSQRSANEIEIMLDVLCEQMGAKKDDDGEFHLPPPEFNWQLYGTWLWRCICSIHHDQCQLSPSVERWEYVGAVALYFMKKAVALLKRQPIGLGQAPPEAGGISQRALTEARHWHVLAVKEKEVKFLKTGRKIREAGEKGNKSPHKNDQRELRRQLILAEGKALQELNSSLSLSDVAKKISTKYKNERGYGWRTVYSVLKDVKQN